MIREHRNREKLINYYKIFINKGITDPNVHPWIKESWELSKQYQVNPKKFMQLLDYQHMNWLNYKANTVMLLSI